MFKGVSLSSAVHGHGMGSVAFEYTKSIQKGIQKVYERVYERYAEPGQDVRLYCGALPAIPVSVTPDDTIVDASLYNIGANVG